MKKQNKADEANKFAEEHEDEYYRKKWSDDNPRLKDPFDTE